MNEVHIYIPTEEDKELIKERCQMVIESLTGLSLVQKAMVLKLVTEGFVKIHGVEQVQVIRDE